MCISSSEPLKGLRWRNINMSAVEAPALCLGSCILGKLDPHTSKSSPQMSTGSPGHPGLGSFLIAIALCLPVTCLGPRYAAMLAQVAVQHMRPPHTCAIKSEEGACYSSSFWLLPLLENIPYLDQVYSEAFPLLWLDELILLLLQLSI